MKSFFFAAASVLAVAALCRADDISGTVSCSVNDPTVGTAVGCPASVGRGSADAGFSGSITPTSVEVSGSAFATFSFGGPPGFATASVSAGGSLTLYTLGPVRPGFIVFTTTDAGPGQGPTQAPWTAGINLGDLTDFCEPGPANSIFCNGALANPKSLTGTGTGTLPFTLGETYVFSDGFTGSANASGGCNFCSSSSSSGALGLTYYLTDANGNPVDVFVAATPEPGSLLLVVKGMLLLALVALSRSKV